MRKKAKRPIKKKPAAHRPDALITDPRAVFRAMERDQAAMERLLDDRAFESDEEAAAFVNRMVAEENAGIAPITPLHKAQDLIYEAWEIDDPFAQVCFALKALHICRDCADAYVLLAEAALDEEQTRDILAEGVAAGERTLGPQFFDEHAGDFWGIIRSRPYVRARTALAHTLWEMGERDQAIAHYLDLLRLNPNDNMALRWVLVSHLLEIGRDDDARRIFDLYPDEPSASMLYPRALYEFRQSGDSEDARERLNRAMDQNKHVPSYLLERKRVPDNLPMTFTYGSIEEAMLYADEDGAAAWRTTPGALAWLERIVDERYRRKPASA